MADIFERLKKNPYLKQHLNWKMALCQHMMYLLIDEDRGEPILGERELPWGAPDAGVYVERFERNLQSLQDVPELLISFQIAAVDMESIARDFPHVADNMIAWHKKGRLDFVGGSFSQAHMQCVGSESNWRQFEWGKKLFKEMFGKDIKLYARQETGFHQQTPQILEKFGYDMIVMPQFPWAMEIVDGKFEVMSSHLGASFIQGDEFVDAVALDGTELPAYLTSYVASYGDGDPTHPGGSIPAQHAHNYYNVKRAISKDLYAPPTVWPYFPDMMEVDRDFYERINEFCALDLLEPAMQQRLKEAPPRAKARVFSHWSYYEGEWAEELARANKSAEEKAVLLEAVEAMARQAGLKDDVKDQIKDIWHTILKYQHHDVLWIEITDLRRKSVNYLKDAITKGNQLMEALSKGIVEDANDTIAIFNGLPYKRKALIEVDSDDAAAGSLGLQAFDGKCLGFKEVPAGGFTSVDVSDIKPSTSNEQPMPSEIVTDNYTVALCDNGLIGQVTASDGSKLLNSGNYQGGQMRAMMGDEWFDNRQAECKFHSGDVFDIVERKARINSIPVTERYFFFKSQNLIKAELDFDFNGDEIGYFWLDETKLNVYYPTAGSEAYHDMPYGFAEARQGRPLFATNWTYCGGLVYVNRGTIKHWIKDDVIANVIAWGSNIFGNRIHFDFWTSKQQYDINVYGKHTIEYFLIPQGKFDGSSIVRQVSDVTTPVFMTNGKGEKSFYELKDNGYDVTAMYEDNGQLWTRGYKLPSGDASKYRDFEIFSCPAKDMPSMDSE